MSLADSVSLNPPAMLSRTPSFATGRIVHARVMSRLRSFSNGSITKVAMADKSCRIFRPLNQASALSGSKTLRTRCFELQSMDYGDRVSYIQLVCR